MTTEPTPWRVLIALAQSLGVAPAAFWRLSLREWRALTRPQNDRLSQAGLDHLMQQFPDHTHGRP
jgi:uncharacterized phage protein (TIGR02216 family)